MSSLDHSFGQRLRGFDAIRVASCVAAVVGTVSLTLALALSGIGDWHVVALLALVAFVAEGRPMRVSSAVELAVSFIPIIMAAVLFGPGAAALVGVIGMLGDRGGPWEKWVIYARDRAVSGVVAGLAAGLVTDAWSSTSLPSLLAASAAPTGQPFAGGGRSRSPRTLSSASLTGAGRPCRTGRAGWSPRGVLVGPGRTGWVSMAATGGPRRAPVAICSQAVSQGQSGPDPGPWTPRMFVMGSQRRESAPEYKDEAVKLVVNTGRAVATVARELGVKEQTLGRWVNFVQDPSGRRGRRGSE